MIIIGAAMNHWYYMGTTDRSVINMLVMCGCVGPSGGGWTHYVGQENQAPDRMAADLTRALRAAMPEIGAVLAAERRLATAGRHNLLPMVGELASRDQSAFEER